MILVNSGKVGSCHIYSKLPVFIYREFFCALILIRNRSVKPELVYEPMILVYSGKVGSYHIYSKHLVFSYMEFFLFVIFELKRSVKPELVYEPMILVNSGKVYFDKLSTDIAAIFILNSLYFLQGVFYILTFLLHSLFADLI
jgi:hypothetical protein